MATNSKATSLKNETPVVAAVRKALAETFALYVKTHGYHWNVEGPHFKSLHELFEEQYTEMWNALDDLAERLRSLGVYAPSSAAALLSGSDIADEKQVPSAPEMLDRLIAGQASVIAALKAGVEAAEDDGDVATADLLTERLDVHEKAVWMLKSTRKGM